MSGVMSNHANSETLHARLMLAEIPCTDRLKEDPSVLRLREGSALNNSLINFKIITDSLKSGSKSAVTFAPYRSAKLTSVLHEALGGNMHTLVLTVVSQGQFDDSKQAMLLARNLSGIRNFPVSNSATTLGLLNRYRSEIKKLFAEVENSGSSKAATTVGKGGDDSQYQDELQAKLHDLEGKIVITNLEKVKAVAQFYRKPHRPLNQFYLCST